MGSSYPPPPLEGRKKKFGCAGVVFIFFVRPRPTVETFEVLFGHVSHRQSCGQRNDKRAGINGKKNNTRTNHSSVQPLPLAVRRIGKASAFCLVAGVAGNTKQLQIPPSPRAL